MKPTKQSTVATLPALRKQVAPIMQQALELRVTSAASYDTAMQHARELKAAAKRVATEKAKMLDILKAAVAVERDRWRPVEQIIEETDEILREKMLKFVEEDAARQQREEEKIIAAGYKNQSTVIRKIAAVEEAVTTGTSTRKELVITDVTLIPREYLLPDEVALRKALLEGAAIPGVELQEKKIIVVR